MKSFKLILISLVAVAISGCGAKVPDGVSITTQSETPRKITVFQIADSQWKYKVVEICYNGTVYLRLNAVDADFSGFTPKIIAGPNTNDGQLSNGYVEKC